MLPTIKWENDKVIMVDQRALPLEEVYIDCTTVENVAEAIETMIIRGAPAIGVAAAYGIALGVCQMKNGADRREEFGRIYARLERTRPTARNLFWALERMRQVFERNIDLELQEIRKIMLAEAHAVEAEDIATNKKMGSWGKSLIQDGDIILTHCNAGALATAGYGTALGLVRAAFAEGKKITVYADETRPFLQGARLTCWELARDHIPVVLITDNMAGALMKRGEISLVITGADRISRNGDTANKIGTYPAAVLAKENGLPFYVAAPLSTVDFSLADGSEIPIEERDAREVREIDGHPITLPDIEVRNPAFDVTPGEYITAIVTEAGIAYPPFTKSLEGMRKRTA